MSSAIKTRQKGLIDATDGCEETIDEQKTRDGRGKFWICATSKKNLKRKPFFTRMIHPSISSNQATSDQSKTHSSIHSSIKIALDRNTDPFLRTALFLAAIWLFHEFSRISELSVCSSQYIMSFHHKYNIIISASCPFFLTMISDIPTDQPTIQPTHRPTNRRTLGFIDTLAKIIIEFSTFRVMDEVLLKPNFCVCKPSAQGNLSVSWLWMEEEF